LLYARVVKVKVRTHKYSVVSSFILKLRLSEEVFDSKFRYGKSVQEIS
jgi:hypothetical protein